MTAGGANARASLGMTNGMLPLVLALCTAAAVGSAACDGELDHCAMEPTMVSSWHGLSNDRHDLEVIVTLGTWVTGEQICIDWLASGAGFERLTYLAPGARAIQTDHELLLLEAASSSWAVLASASQGSKYEAELRCPTGCEFRLQPEVQYFESPPTSPSVRVKRQPLPPKSPSAARVELWLRGEEWNQWLCDELEEALVSLLRLRQPPVFVETHAGGSKVFLVVDLLDGSEDASEAAVFRLEQLLATPHSREAKSVVARLQSDVRLLVGEQWEVVDPSSASASLSRRNFRSAPAMVAGLAFGGAALLAAAYRALAQPARHHYVRQHGFRLVAPEMEELAPLEG